MQTKKVIENIDKYLGIKINRQLIFFYERKKLIVANRDKDNNRKFSWLQYANLCKAVLLSRFGFGLKTIDSILNQKDKDVIRGVREDLKLRKEWIQKLKEII